MYAQRPLRLPARLAHGFSSSLWIMHHLCVIVHVYIWCCLYFPQIKPTMHVIALIYMSQISHPFVFHIHIFIYCPQYTWLGTHDFQYNQVYPQKTFLWCDPYLMCNRALSLSTLDVVKMTPFGVAAVDHFVGVTIFRPGVYMCLNVNVFSCFDISVWVCLPLDICMHVPVHVSPFASMRMHMGMHADQVYPCVWTSTCVISWRHNIWLLPRTIVNRTMPDSTVYGCQHGARLGPTGPGWAPCWSHEPYYLGYADKTSI